MTFDEMAAALEASGDYRVLRRLQSSETGYLLTDPVGAEMRHGIVLDAETTGLDPKQHEIIELAMVPFSFTADGLICEIGAPYQSLRQPSGPIPPEITAITGLDDAAVAGHSIDPNEVVAFIKSAGIIIAHYSGFDRPFAEQLCPAFAEKCWGCSQSEIDWQAEGLESTKLAWLIMRRGLFYDGHRALDDCHALIELLRGSLRSGMPVLKALLDRARQPTWRIWATGAPFETKDILKARGYRWSPGEAPWPKSWYQDGIGEAEKDAEIAFLHAHIYRRAVSLKIDGFTAFDRFSERTTPT